MERATSLMPDFLFPDTNEKPRSGSSREAAYPFVVRHAGLCVSCNNARSCTFSRDSRVPVKFCEEFDGSAAQTSPCRSKSTGAAVETAVAPGEMPLGLCGNCAHLGGCTFPKFEGGVWQCEEYE